MFKSLIKSLSILLFVSVLVLASPVANAESEKKSSLSEYWQEDGKKYNLACENGSSFKKVEEDTLELNSGTFLVEAEGALKLKLPLLTLDMRPRSMVLIRNTPGRNRIYGLLETASAVCDKHEVPLHCGEELLFSDHMPTPNELTGEFDVGVRKLVAVEISEFRKVATMEYSMLQAMTREPLLMQISHSRHSHDKFLKDKVLKSAASIEFATSRHGPYQGSAGF